MIIKFNRDLFLSLTNGEFFKYRVYTGKHTLFRDLHPGSLIAFHAHFHIEIGHTLEYMQTDNRTSH